QGIPPGKEHLAWVTNTVTLIDDEHDAVLVDMFLLQTQSRELVDWVAKSGKTLTTIFVTLAHGDHCFGLQLLLDRFPNAKAIATAAVVAGIEAQIEPEFVRTYWESRFPGQIPSRLAAPQALEGESFTLEGDELNVLELGHSDTAHSTGVYVASI